MSEGNGYITREDLLKATRTRYAEFPIPDDFPIESLAGKKIRIKTMSSKEKSAFEEFFNDPLTGEPDPKRAQLRREKMIIDCVVDGNGARMFSLDDIRELQKVDGPLVVELGRRIFEHNRLMLAADIEKKSEETTDSGSS